VAPSPAARAAEAKTAELERKLAQLQARQQRLDARREMLDSALTRKDDRALFGLD